MLKKLLVLATTAISLASAASLTIDDFSVNQGPLTATGSTGPIAIGGGVSRTLSLTSFGGIAPIAHRMEVAYGLLDMINGSGDNSAMVLSYDLPLLVSSASNVQVILDVLLTDGNETQVILGGLGSGFAVIPGNTMNVSYNFGMSDGNVGPGNLSFMFTGEKGWDAAVTSVRLDYEAVPEPATYAMMGAGLVVMGFIRRRKA